MLLLEGRRASLTDLIGTATVVMVAGPIVLALQYPVLAYLARRRRVSRAQAALLAAGVINLPVYFVLALAQLRGGFFAPGEGILIGSVYAVLAMTFAWCYQSITSSKRSDSL